MRIRVLRNLGRDLPVAREGEIITVPDDSGKLLVEAGLAEIVDEPARVIEQPPPKPAKKERPTAPPKPEQ